LAKNDCLEQFRRRLLEEGVLSKSEVEQYQDEVRDEVTRATRQGLDSPEAPAENALTNVYSTQVPGPIEPAPGVETEDMNMVAAIRDALSYEMEHDERVMVLGEDVGPKGGVFLVTDGLYHRFGANRVIDTPL